MKPGWKSSELWLSLVAVLLGAFISSGLLPDTHVVVKVAGIAATALSAFGYSALRTKLKSGGKDR